MWTQSGLATGALQPLKAKPALPVAMVVQHIAVQIIPGSAILQCTL